MQGVYQGRGEGWGYVEIMDSSGGRRGMKSVAKKKKKNRSYICPIVRRLFDHSSVCSLYFALHICTFGVPQVNVAQGSSKSYYTKAITIVVKGGKTSALSE